MGTTRTEVPHIWVTKQLSDGSFVGKCGRCGWEIQGTDSTDYKNAQDERTKEGYGCFIVQRDYHETYVNVNGKDGWVCHHCGLTSTAAAEMEENPPCIYPDPAIERQFEVNKRHHWSYQEKTSDCRCTCESCGHTVTAASRSAAMLLTAREDKNVPCVMKHADGLPTKTIKSKDDPEYGEKCQGILEDLVEIRHLMNDESKSLTVMALHEASFEKLLQRAAALVEEYED